MTINSLPVRVLHIINSMGNAGTENFIMNYYRHIDRKLVQFDFLTFSNNRGYFEEEIEALGGKIFHATTLNSHPFVHFYTIYKCVKTNHYRIVHRHTGSAIGYLELIAAKAAGANKLIIHSHASSAGYPSIHNLSRHILKLNKCTNFACSQLAGNYFFGKNGKFSIIKNAIDVNEFTYNKLDRELIRKKLNLTNENILIGHVGRFSAEKNHRFLIKIFKEITKINDKARLILFGDGKMRSEIEDFATSIGIYKYIYFAGVEKNIAKFYSAMDLFIFPSLYEGLGIAAIEAQCAGLPVIASDQVPKEVNITGLVTFLSLSDLPKYWAIKCIEIISMSTIMRNEVVEKIRASGYDIKTASKELSNYYLSLSCEE